MNCLNSLFNSGQWSALQSSHEARQPSDVDDVNPRSMRMPILRLDGISDRTIAPALPIPVLHRI